MAPKTEEQQIVDVKQKLREGIETVLRHQIEEHFDLIWESLCRSFTRHNPEKPGKFKFPFGVSCTIKPRGGEYDVKASSHWGKSESGEPSAITVSNQPGLPGIQ